MNKPSIGVLGHGFIGKVISEWYADGGYTVHPFDINGDYDLKATLNSDIVFVAINAKDNFASVENRNILSEYFKHIPDNTLVIIKSTVVPGTTDYLDEVFPKLPFCYNPEFLTEMTAFEDFNSPDIQILGLPHRSLEFAGAIFDLLPDAPVKRIVSPRDAETIKHATNSYYAMKLIFFNELYDASSTLGCDYETVKEVLSKNQWIGDSHNVVFHKGYRGFGDTKVSKCIPKDTTAFAKLTGSELLSTTLKVNERIYRK